MDASGKDSLHLKREEKYSFCLWLLSLCDAWNMTAAVFEPRAGRGAQTSVLGTAEWKGRCITALKILFGD